jgi:glycosyltransferase involved in cell wall biosynthesis
VAAIASISEFTLERLRGWADIPATVTTSIIPNAVDLEKYTPGPRNESLLARWSLRGRRVLLTLGRMDAAEQAKGFDEILEALPAIAAEFPTVAYLIVGDGSDRKRLETKVARLSLTERVRFTGYVAEAEKPEYYRLADVFVMPSRLEGFGFVFLEALACGVPVIASKVDGSREAVRNGALGMQVDPSRPGEVIAAICATLREPFLPPRSELEYFSSERFEARCHALIDTLRAESVR